MQDPYMRVTLGGTVVEGALLAHMTSVSVKEAAGELDSAEIQFELTQSTAKDLAKKLSLHGQEFAVEMMIAGKPLRTVAGDIVQMTWSRSGSSPRSVTITGIDHLARLKKPRANSEKQDRQFRDEKASAIVEKVAKDWSLGSEIDSTDADIKFLDWKKDDSALLKHLACEFGYDVRLDVSKAGTTPKLLFKKCDPKNTAGSVSFEFGVDCYDISATHNLDEIRTKVTMAGVDYAAGDDAVEGVADGSSLVKGDITGVSLVKQYFGDVHEVKEKTDGTSSSQPLAKEEAEGILRSKANTFVSGNATCEFTPLARSGAEVTFKGTGWPLDGKFKIKEVTHSFDASGYTTSFSFEGAAISSP